MKAGIVKHIECSGIYISFSEFKVEEVSDDILVKMFQNIENRV